MSNLSDTDEDVILEATNLKRHFEVGNGYFSHQPPVRAVDGISLRIRRGETFAIVGESGCGKSTLARLLMRLIPPSSGTVQFEQDDIQSLKGPELKKLRRDMQFIFQDPFSSLNPRMTVGKLVGEPLETHAPHLNASERRTKVAEMLQQVGLRPEHASRYPHEFSGGQRQRIGIARALASGPKLVIGDEPVSALDVSVQAQVINLLGDLRDRLGLTLIIIAHDLAVIRHMSDRVAVMYLGQIVETGPADEVFANARHPYTMALLSAIPEPIHGHQGERVPLKGETPSPATPPAGCRFHTRCSFARADCSEREPELRPAPDANHLVACHYWEKIGAEQATKPAPKAHELRADVQSRFALYRDAIGGARTMPRQIDAGHDQGE